MKLDTTDRELDALWKRLHAVREGTQTVAVPKEALRHLLQDHASLITRLGAPPLRLIPETTP